MDKKYSIVFKGEIRPNIFHFDVILINGDLSYSAPVGTVITNMNLNQDSKSKGFAGLPAELYEYREQIMKECVEMSSEIEQVFKFPN